MKKSLLFCAFIILVFSIVSCTDEGRTVKTLEKAGYSEIQTTGYAAFECGKDDDFHTGFRAKNPAGTLVEGTVCCGFLKGCTIRF
jgi:hypothetical protein